MTLGVCWKLLAGPFFCHKSYCPWNNPSDECSGDDDSVDNYHGMIITRLFNLQNKYWLFWLKMYNGINIYDDSEDGTSKQKGAYFIFQVSISSQQIKHKQ